MVETVQERENILQEIQTAIRHMAVYGVGNLLVKALGFFMLPFYTHYLGPTDYGILEILDLSMTLVSLVLNMGLTPAFLRCYAATGSAEEKRTFVATGCLFGFTTGLATMALGVAFIRPITHLIFGHGVPASYVLLSFLALALNYIALLPRTYLRALEASGMYVTFDTIGVFALLFLNIFFIAVMKLGIAGVLWSSFIVAAVQCVGFSIWAAIKTGIRFHMPHLRRILGFGLPLILSNIGLFVLNFSDRFFLQHLRSLEVVGVYAVGYKFGFMMNYLMVQPFFTMWQTRMYAIHARPDHRAIFRHIFSLYSFFLIYAGLAMCLFGSEALRLMAEQKFWGGAAVIPVVILSYVFYGLSYYAQLGLLLTDRTKQVGAAGACAAGLCLIFNYFLIKSFGMMGAAWATALSFLSLAAISYVLSQRAFPLQLGLGRMGAALATAAAMFIVCHLLKPGNPFLAIGLKCISLAAFPAVLWKTGIMPAGTAAVLAAGWNKVVGKVAKLRPLAARRGATEAL